MKTKTVLMFILMILLTGYQIHGQSVASKDGFIITVKSNKISVLPGHEDTIELELVRSKSYLDRILEVKMEQVPAGILAQIDKSRITGGDIKISIIADDDIPLGKHMMICSIRDKYRKKSIVLTINVISVVP